MECYDDRKRRARESNVALQDLEKAMSRCKRRDGDGQLPCEAVVKRGRVRGRQRSGRGSGGH